MLLPLWLRFFASGTGQWRMPCVLLVLMLVSAYLCANTLFLISDLLGQRWHIGLTLASGIQSIVFAVSLVASIACGKLRQLALRWIQRRDDAAPARAMEQASIGAPDTTSSLNPAEAKVRAEVVLTQASQLIATGAVVICMISFSFGNGSAGTSALFVIACTLSMVGYNIQAASLPSLYSQSLPADIRASLVPWYAATVAAGKLAAPPITQALGDSTHHGWVASQSVPLTLAIVAIIVLLLVSKRLVAPVRHTRPNTSSPFNILYRKCDSSGSRIQCQVDCYVQLQVLHARNCESV